MFAADSDVDGQIIVNDFNTWLARRSNFLKEMTEDLGMTLVDFSPDRRSRYLGTLRKEGVQPRQVN
jgi:hypothetical protein